MERRSWSVTDQQMSHDTSECHQQIMWHQSYRSMSHHIRNNRRLGEDPPDLELTLVVWVRSELVSSISSLFYHRFSVCNDVPAFELCDWLTVSASLTADWRDGTFWLDLELLQLNVADSSSFVSLCCRCFVCLNTDESTSVFISTPVCLWLQIGWQDTFQNKIMFRD